MTKIYKPHDSIFKNTMSSPKVAKEFFNNYLPNKIKEKIDLNNLSIQDSSHISPTLKASYTDMLFQTTFSGNPGYIYILVEHTSSSDKWLPLRTTQYMLSIMNEHQERTKSTTLPIVYPMIFHASNDSYSCSTSLIELFDEPDGLISEILFKPIQLIDLAKIDIESLNHLIHFSIVASIMKRDVSSLDRLLRIKHQLLEVEKEGDENFLKAIYTYSIYVAEEQMNPEEFVQKATEGLSYQTKRSIMTTIAEQFIEQGKQLGREQGLQQGMEKGKKERNIEIAKGLLATHISIDTITKVTGLTDKEIQTLRLKSVKDQIDNEY